MNDIVTSNMNERFLKNDSLYNDKFYLHTNNFEQISSINKPRTFNRFDKSDIKLKHYHNRFSKKC